MGDQCHNPAKERHEIADGKRRVMIAPLTLDWGNDDLRDSWQGTYVFCSFHCLADWASEKSAQHDGLVLKEGQG